MLDVLGEAALRTLLLAVVVGCGLRLLRIRQPHLLLAAWTVVLVASLAMPMLARLAPLRVPVLPAFPTMLIDDAGGPLPGTTVQVPPTEILFDERPERSFGWWLEAIYVVVAASIAFRVLLGVALSLRLLAKSAPLHAEWVGGTRVRISRDVVTPVTIAHTILLPPDAESWSADTRRAVLAHEQAHVARWDFAMLVLAQLNRALFWFSPFSWWLHRRLVVLSELASDDQALAVTRDPLGYAEILLEMGRRPGPVLPGPAMAKLSTLASRIDRILEGPSYQHVDPFLRLVLTAAVAGLSFAAASLVPDPVQDLDIRPLPRQLVTEAADAPGSQLSPVARPDLDKSGLQSEPAPALAELPVTTSLSLNSAIAPEPPVQGYYVQQPAVRPSTASAQRPPLPTSSRTAPSPTLALPPRSSTQDPGHQPSNGKLPRFQPLEAKKVSTLRAEDSDAATWISSQAGNGGRLSLPIEVSPAPPSLQHSLDYEDIMRSTCTGTIAVGLRARQSTQPNVVAGQTVEARAQFFRRESGASWVRFFAFGRPPLDLPVHFAQGRVTWTGEYGIAYAVQPSGGDHLVGLAAQVASDSAQLEFTCRKSTVRTL